MMQCKNLVQLSLIWLPSVRLFLIFLTENIRPSFNPRPFWSFSSDHRLNHLALEWSGRVRTSDRCLAAKLATAPAHCRTLLYTAVHCRAQCSTLPHTAQHCRTLKNCCKISAHCHTFLYIAAHVCRCSLIATHAHVLPCVPVDTCTYVTIQVLTIP